MKAHFNQLLDEQRKKVHHLEENVLKVKMSYADALHNLEEISDEIHQKRELSDKSMESQNVSPSQSNALWENHYHNSYRPFSKSSSNECGMKWKSEELAADVTNTLSPSSKLSRTREYNESTTKANVSLGRDACESSTVIKPLNELTLDNEPSHLYSTSKNSCQVLSNSPECSEVQDQKLHVIDLNILRVQREDISDSESLASNDTIDTLDDNQIECLLLDQVLPTEYEKPLSHES